MPCSERFSRFSIRDGPPWMKPLEVTQSLKSTASVLPLSHIPSSETGSSSLGKSVLYDLTAVRSVIASSPSWSQLV